MASRGFPECIFQQSECKELSRPAMNDMTAGYVKSALDYHALEARCDLFERK